jgi:hypothetical protein
MINCENCENKIIGMAYSINNNNVCKECYENFIDYYEHHLNEDDIVN